MISAFDEIADVIQQWIVRKRKRKTREELWCACESEKSVRVCSMGCEKANIHLRGSMPCLFEGRQGFYVMSRVCPVCPSFVVLFHNCKTFSFFFLTSRIQKRKTGSSTGSVLESSVWSETLLSHPSGSATLLSPPSGQTKKPNRDQVITKFSSSDLLVGSSPCLIS